MKKRILGFFLSVASVYMVMSLLTMLFVDMLSNFVFTM
jgi:hypothetical protein